MAARLHFPGCLPATALAGPAPLPGSAAFVASVRSFLAALTGTRSSGVYLAVAGCLDPATGPALQSPVSIPLTDACNVAGDGDVSWRRALPVSAAGAGAVTGAAGSRQSSLTLLVTHLPATLAALAPSKYLPPVTLATSVAAAVQSRISVLGSVGEAGYAAGAGLNSSALYSDACRLMALWLGLSLGTAVSGVSLSSPGANPLCGMSLDAGSVAAMPVQGMEQALAAAVGAAPLNPPASAAAASGQGGGEAQGVLIGSSVGGVAALLVCALTAYIVLLHRRAAKGAAAAAVLSSKPGGVGGGSEQGALFTQRNVLHGGAAGSLLLPPSSRRALLRQSLLLQEAEGEGSEHKLAYISPDVKASIGRSLRFVGVDSERLAPLVTPGSEARRAAAEAEGLRHRQAAAASSLNPLFAGAQQQQQQQHSSAAAAAASAAAYYSGESPSFATRAARSGSMERRGVGGGAAASLTIAGGLSFANAGAGEVLRARARTLSGGGGLPPPSKPPLSPAAASESASASPLKPAASATKSSRWTAHFSGEVGRVFFVHAGSGRTSWECPAEADTVANVPAGWRPVASGIGGGVHFVHAEGGAVCRGSVPTAATPVGSAQEEPRSALKLELSGKEEGAASPAGAISSTSSAAFTTLSSILSSSSSTSTAASSPHSLALPSALSSNSSEATTFAFGAAASPRQAQGATGSSFPRAAPASASKAAEDALQAGLPPGWRAIRNPGIGKVYYFNDDSGETVWERPT